MSNVGWIGLGRLGAPCAAALAKFGGHTVYGYDVRGNIPESYDWSDLPPIELTTSVADVVRQTDDIVYLAVQTPHAHEYGGETITPNEPRDFEYGYLVQAVRDVARAAIAQRKYVSLVIVSTVLPGTFNRHLRSLLNEWVTPIYHPFFIAMGTVVQDFVGPEMVLFGVDVPGHEEAVRELYEPFHSAPAPVMSINSAELTKVAYNTFISSKIVFANSLMQLAEATGADVDEVTDALALGADRITSAKYLTAGVGDGGACHPRDNVALSAIARRYGIQDLMGYLTRAREDQTRWLAKIVIYWADLTQLPITILGKSYKPGVKLVDGSPGLLLRHIIETEHNLPVQQLDPIVESVDRQMIENHPLRRAVYVIMTKHEEFRALPITSGSIVIDPFGYVTVGPNVTLVTPGRHGKYRERND